MVGNTWGGRGEFGSESTKGSQERYQAAPLFGVSEEGMIINFICFEHLSSCRFIGSTHHDHLLKFSEMFLKRLLFS